MVCMIGLALCTNKFLFLLLFSVLFGVSTINYMPPIICSWKHFPNSRGTVTGVVMSGFALGPLLFNFLAKTIVNPNGTRADIEVDRGQLIDYYYGPAVANNVPRMFAILAGLWGLMLTFAIVTIREPEEHSVEVDEISDEDRRDSFLIASKSFSKIVDRHNKLGTISENNETPYINFRIFCGILRAGMH